MSAEGRIVIKSSAMRGTIQISEGKASFYTLRKFLLIRPLPWMSLLIDCREEESRANKEGGRMGRIDREELLLWRPRFEASPASQPLAARGIPAHLGQRCSSALLNLCNSRQKPSLIARTSHQVGAVPYWNEQVTSLGCIGLAKEELTCPRTLDVQTLDCSTVCLNDHALIAPLIPPCRKPQLIVYKVRLHLHSLDLPFYNEQDDEHVPRQIGHGQWQECRSR